MRAGPPFPAFRLWKRGDGRPRPIALLLFCLLAPACGLLSTAASPPTEAELEEINEWMDESQLDRAEERLLPYVDAYPEHPEVAYLRSRLYLLRGDSKSGLAWMRKAHTLAPRQAKYAAGLGSAYGARIVDVNLAAKATMVGKITKYYELAMELDHTLPEPWFGLIEYYIQAPGIVGGSMRKAKRMADDFSQVNPFMGHLARARIAFHEEKFDRALLELKQAIALEPDDRRGHFALVILANNREEYNLAIQSIDFLLETDPEDFSATYQLGKYAALSGQQLDRGEAALKQYIAWDERPGVPSHASAYWRLGMIYENRSDPAAARQAYEQALILEPNLEVAQEALENLG